MRSFEQYDEICKYFAEGKQRDNDANEIQKHLQLYDLSLGEYLVIKYALWLDFRTIDENELHGTGRHIENASEGITLQVEKKAESAGALNAYIYLMCIRLIKCNKSRETMMLMKFKTICNFTI